MPVEADVSRKDFARREGGRTLEVETSTAEAQGQGCSVLSWAGLGRRTDRNRSVGERCRGRAHVDGAAASPPWLRGLREDYLERGDSGGREGG